jgi:hypothetical protein
MRYLVILKREKCMTNTEKKVLEMVLKLQVFLIFSTYSVWEEEEKVVHNNKKK